MAQRIFASATEAAAQEPATAGDEGAAAALEARARAAAYLDLWEAQVAHAAAHGPHVPGAGRRTDRPAEPP